MIDRHMGSRTDTISFIGSVATHDGATELIQTAGDVVLVEREKPRMLVMRCPSGCGDDLIINLDKRVGYAWRFYRNNSGFTLFPSYWRSDGCKSHFIIWNSKIYWCYGWESEEASTWSTPAEIERLVLNALPQTYFLTYEEIAERLNLIPWEVLQACRQLVRNGLAVRNEKPNDREFRRVKLRS
jgi:hypothetical protein